MNTRIIAENLKSLAVFRCILKDSTVAAYVKLCENPDGENLGEFVWELYKKGENFTKTMLDIVLLSENLCSIKKAKGEEIPGVIAKTAMSELDIINEAATVGSEAFGQDGMWEVCDIDFKSAFNERLDNITNTGFGVFADNIMFTLEGREILPAIFRDDITVDSLKGYKLQREEIENNIKALVKGKVAANMLLYGDSGTGKSATVKALVNLYAPMGVRLIEIKKNQIDMIPYIMGKVSENPLKFILFLDDLTFSPTDDAFANMKAVLEGSVTARAKNTCICVTSNRRNLVKESAADREGGDLHRRDTMEDIGALTQRFGLSVIYEKPNRVQYTKLVEDLAKDYDIEIGENEIKEAEAYAISKGGRSCRVAKQYVEHLLRLKE